MMNKPSILVVDDRWEYCLLYKGLLESEYHVFSATTGEAALDLLGRYLFRVVVTDLDMAPMSGVELIERMSANPATASIPVIVCTAADDRSWFKSRERVSTVISKLEITSKLPHAIASLLRSGNAAIVGNRNAEEPV